MEFELSTSCYVVPETVRVTVLFCMAWPIIAAALFRRHETSAGPMAAIAVPFALSVGLTWYGLYGTLFLVARYGKGAATAAGITESFAPILLGFVTALAVLVAAALRRHRPFLDRTTAMLFALPLLGFIGALVFAKSLSRSAWTMGFSIAVSVIALIVAIAAVVWTLLTGRGRITTRPIPYGVTAITLLLIVTCGVAWQTAHHYRDLAMHGWR